MIRYTHRAWAWGLTWSRESRLQPALYFFYKVLGIVKDTTYLCIVMRDYTICSLVPHLIENKKFMTSFNKKLKDRPFEFISGNYGVDGYPQLKVVKGELVFKVCVTKGYIKYYRQTTYSDVMKGNSIHRRLSNRIRHSLKSYLFDKYAKHIGIRAYEFTVSRSWV